jgi:hypothetical protein
VSSYQSVDMISLVLGGLIILAVIFAHRIGIPAKPLSFERDKLKLSIDTVQLLLLLGFIFACTGAVFRYLAGDDVKKQLAQEQAKRAVLEEVQGERLRAILTFPGVDFDPEKIAKVWAEDEFGAKYPVRWETGGEKNSVVTEPPVFGLRLGSTVQFKAQTDKAIYTGDVKGQVARAIVEMQRR